MINLLLGKQIFVFTDARFDRKMLNDGHNTKEAWGALNGEIKHPGMSSSLNLLTQYYIMTEIRNK